MEKRRYNEPYIYIQIEDWKLTVAEIAEHAGVHVDTIYKRLERGITGRDLLAKRHAGKRKHYKPRKS